MRPRHAGRLSIRIIIGMIQFHYPDVESWKKKRGLIPYASEDGSPLPAAQRDEFQALLADVRQHKAAVLVSDPEILGARPDFEAAKAKIQKAGGRLFVLADLEGERVRGLFDEPRLAALTERFAGGRAVHVYPISESPLDVMDEHCCAPSAERVDLYLRQKVKSEEVVQEIIRASMFEEGYPAFEGYGMPGEWTESLWIPEIQRRASEAGFDLVPLSDAGISMHREHSIHSYGEDDLLASFVLRSRTPTHAPDERDEFLARVRARNPKVAGMGEVLLELLGGGERMRTSQTARAEFEAVASHLREWEVADYQVRVWKEAVEQG